MDPLAHTLVGACLAETRLRRLSPLAAPALILAANAPDIDAIAMSWSRDLALGVRRGWTHGVLAMAVLPLAVAAVLLLADRARCLLRQGAATARAGPVIALCYLGLLTHPALDWLNTYGIRLLMPIDGRWFYGDALFIVDPWIWLLAGGPVVLARTRTWLGGSAWLMLGGAATLLLNGFAVVPPGARLVWGMAVAAIVGLRLWGGLQAHIPRLAAGCLLCASVYAAAMAAGSRLAAARVEAWLAAHGERGAVVMAGPVPANPFARDVVVRDGARYRFIDLDWTRSAPIRVAGPPIPRGVQDAAVAAALAAPHVQGTRTWLRLPAHRVEATDAGYRVTIRDVRYARNRAAGFGTVVVDLDRDLRVRSPR